MSLGWHCDVWVLLWVLVHEVISLLHSQNQHARRVRGRQNFMASEPLLLLPLLPRSLLGVAPAPVLPLLEREHIFSAGNHTSLPPPQSLQLFNLEEC